MSPTTMTQHWMTATVFLALSVSLSVSAQETLTAEAHSQITKRSAQYSTGKPVQIQPGPQPYPFGYPQGFPALQPSQQAQPMISSPVAPPAPADGSKRQTPAEPVASQRQMSSPLTQALIPVVRQYLAQPGAPNQFTFYVPGATQYQRMCTNVPYCVNRPYSTAGYYISCQIVSVPAPAPQPIPQPVPQPIIPMPQPVPIPQPVPMPQPIPIPQPIPQPMPQPVPIPQPIPQPMPQPVNYFSCPVYGSTQPAPAPVYRCTQDSDCPANYVCCYNPSSLCNVCVPGIRIAAGFAQAIRSSRLSHKITTDPDKLTVHSIRLIIGHWNDDTVTSFLADAVLPLKLDLKNELHITVEGHRKSFEERETCDALDVNCMGPKLVACISEEAKKDLKKNLKNTLENFNVSRSLWKSLGSFGEDSMGRNFAIEEESNKLDEFEDAELPATEAHVLEAEIYRLRQKSEVKLLTFVTCVLQSFQSGIVELKRSALIAAKKCVRAHKYPWRSVRRCVAHHSTGPSEISHGREVVQTPEPVGPEVEQTLGSVMPVEIIMNGASIPMFADVKQVLCLTLNGVGSYPLLCDLFLQQHGTYTIVQSRVMQPTLTSNATDMNNQTYSSENQPAAHNSTVNEPTAHSSSVNPAAAHSSSVNQAAAHSSSVNQLARHSSSVNPAAAHSPSVNQPAAHNSISSTSNVVEGTHRGDVSRTAALISDARNANREIRQSAGVGIASDDSGDVFSLSDKRELRRSNPVLHESNQHEPATRVTGFTFNRRPYHREN